VRPTDNDNERSRAIALRAVMAGTIRPSTSPRTPTSGFEGGPDDAHRVRLRLCRSVVNSAQDGASRNAPPSYAAGESGSTEKSRNFQPSLTGCRRRFHSSSGQSSMACLAASRMRLASISRRVSSVPYLA
jgi:hypothetical protein